MTRERNAARGVHRLTRHWVENYGMDLEDVPDSSAALLDLRLVAWSDGKLARHHRAEWRRTKARL